jgi:hypothetical protein
VGEINMPKKKRAKVKFEPNFETMELAMNNYLRQHPLLSHLCENQIDIRDLKNDNRRKGASRV